MRETSRLAQGRLVGRSVLVVVAVVAALSAGASAFSKPGAFLAVGEQAHLAFVDVQPRDQERVGPELASKDDAVE